MKFIVVKRLDDFSGIIKKGHLEGEFEAENEEEMKKIAEREDIDEYLDFVIDDYEVYDCDLGNNKAEVFAEFKRRNKDAKLYSK